MNTIEFINASRGHDPESEEITLAANSFADYLLESGKITAEQRDMIAWAFATPSEDGVDVLFEDGNCLFIPR